MDEAVRNLEKWVIDEGKCVTKISVLRQTTMTTRQVESAMKAFYEEHQNLSAVFLVLGTKKLEGNMTEIRQSTLCNHVNLEEVKSKFSRVISVTLYSLHHNPATSVQTLLNADWSGRYKSPVAPIEDRLCIVSPQVLQILKTWKKRNAKTVFSDYVIPDFVLPVKKGPKQLAKSIILKSDQHKLEDSFGITVKNSETIEKMDVDEQKQTTTKRLQELPTESSRKKDSDDELFVVKKKKEDDASLEIAVDAAKCWEQVKNKDTHLKDKLKTEPDDRKPKDKVVESNEQVDKISVKNRPGKVKLEKNDFENSESIDEPKDKPSSTNQKVYKKKELTETYVDGDGMLVTQVVSKMVETDEPVTSKSVALKPTNAKPKPQKGQSSISSFFKKV